MSTRTFQDEYPLAGVKAKIERASHSLEKLEVEANQFLGGGSYALIDRVDPTTKAQSVYITGPEPPLQFSVLSGEIIYQLRSCLDHLVWALVLKNGGGPGRHLQYPICETPQDFRESERKKLKGVSLSARELIEENQPYKISENIQHNFLYVLQELNNVDKHRLLILLVAAITRLHSPEQRTATKFGDLSLTRFYPLTGVQRPTNSGTEILRSSSGKPKIDLTSIGKPKLHLAFENFGVLTEQPIIGILEQVKNRVEKLVMLFEPQFS
jgi:hypothetical protein